MVFRDQRLTCGNCGKTFFFTVTEQRRVAEELGEEHVQSPELCETCRRGGRAAPRGSTGRRECAGRRAPCTVCCQTTRCGGLPT